MNDITALMQKIKAAAITVARDGRTDDEWFYYLQCVHHKNVLALVEALEARDKQIADCEARLNRLEKRCDHKGSVYWDASGVKRCARCGFGIQVIEGEGQ